MPYLECLAVSTNDFNAAGTSHTGATTWAFDRAKMLAGLPATAQTFHLSTSYFGFLPSTLDGKTQLRVRRCD